MNSFLQCYKISLGVKEEAEILYTGTIVKYRIPMGNEVSPEGRDNSYYSRPIKRSIAALIFWKKYRIDNSYWK